MTGVTELHASSRLAGLAVRPVAAWAGGEHTMLGLEFGTVGQRIARLEEACRVVKLLRGEERATFEGKHYRVTEAIANPKPVQQPHPPIWIGGNGEADATTVAADALPRLRGLG